MPRTLGMILSFILHQNTGLQPSVINVPGHIQKLNPRVVKGEEGTSDLVHLSRVALSQPIYLNMSKVSTQTLKIRKCSGRFAIQADVATLNSSLYWHNHIHDQYQLSSNHIHKGKCFISCSEATKSSQAIAIRFPTVCMCEVKNFQKVNPTQSKFFIKFDREQR